MKIYLLAAVLAIAPVSSFAQTTLFQKESWVTGDAYALRTPPPADPGPLIEALRWQVLEESNRQRALAGLPALTGDPVLDAAAAAYSRKMRDLQFFDHVSPDGLTLDSRVPASEMWRYEQVGENLWSGQGALDWRADVIAREAAENWIESPSHRDNLLDPIYSVGGVGAAMVGDQLYITMLYGAPYADEGEAILRRDFGSAPADSTGFGVELEAALTEVIAAARGQLGLAAQQPDGSLAKTARVHAEAMLAGGFLASSDASGVSVLDRVFADNPARSGQIAVALWRGSGGLIWQTDAIIARIVETWQGGRSWDDALNPAFSDIGIGVAVAGDNVLVTVLFGEPSGV